MTPRACIAITALLVSACAQFDTGSVARSSAAALIDCDAESVEVTPVGAYRYRGEGCGRSVIVACTSSQLEPRCLRENAQATAGGEEPEPEAAPSDEIETHIRAGLEARSDDVLACVGRDRIAVRVAYALDGSVDITLQGPLHETAEERCVADALDGVRVAAGHAGTVVHLVR